MKSTTTHSITALSDLLAATTAGRLLVLVAALCAATASAQNSPPAAARAPVLQVAEVMSGLRSPWDLAFAPGGAMLFTEKCHGLSVRLPDGSVRRLFGNGPEYALLAADLFCESQSGVHGIAVDPASPAADALSTCSAPPISARSRAATGSSAWP